MINFIDIKSRWMILIIMSIGFIQFNQIFIIFISTFKTKIVITIFIL